MTHLRYYYQSQAKDQTALRLRIRDLAAARVRYGYRRVHIMLQREGWQVNHKRVYRLYRAQGLELRLKIRKKKRVAAPRGVTPAATAPTTAGAWILSRIGWRTGGRFGY